MCRCMSVCVSVCLFLALLPLCMRALWVFSFCHEMCKVGVAASNKHVWYICMFIFVKRDEESEEKRAS